MGIKITFKKKDKIEYVLPLIVKDTHNSVFMLVKSESNNKIYRIGLVSGKIYQGCYNSIDEYFDAEPDLKIVESELIIE